MQIKEILEKELAGINKSFGEMMSEYTTFKVGGKAECMVFASRIEDIKKTLSVASEYKIPIYVLGNGSNLLVSDEGVKGIVLYIGKEYSEIYLEGNDLVVEAGAKMSVIGKFCLDHGLTGFEFAHGIPGTIGGGAIMNAGAYGGELCQVINKVEAIDFKGNSHVIEGEELGFSYRNSNMKKWGYIVTKVFISLKSGDKEEIKAKMLDLSNKRRDKQPLEYPSAGSTFKRPEGYFAGKLIEDAGLKGYSVGDAQVSEKHCGFVVNKGRATCRDIQKLMEDVERIVLDRDGVLLEPEVIFWG